MKSAEANGEAALVPVAEPAPPPGLVHVPMRLGGWVCKGMDLTGDDRLTVRFEATNTSDHLEIVVLPLTTQGSVFRRLDCCAVRYRGSLSTATAERKQEVGALVLGVANAVDARLKMAPGKSIAEALGRSREAGKMMFSRDSLRALLAPEISDGVPLVEDWSLIDVYPSSHLREALAATLELVLDFRRAKDLRRMLILVAKRDDNKQAFARTTHLSISHISSGATDPPGADELRALVSFVLQLRDHENLQIEFPDVTSDIAPALLMPHMEPEQEAAAANEVLNLAVSSDCHQACAFCSIKESMPADDGGDRVLARLYADLQSNRIRGVRAVRVNGYDPLTYSRILDVLKRATDLGYERADIFSPCTTLSNREFCESIVAAMPEKQRYYIPVYGVTAEIHDRVVGRAGAFDMIMKAIDNLIELLGKDSVCLLSVPTKDAYEQLIPIAAFAERRGLRFYPHMPYPSFETRNDKFYRSAPKQTDVSALMATARRTKRLDIQCNGVAPCVTFRAMREQKVPLRDWLNVPDRPPQLPGTEYRQDTFRHRAGETDHAAFHASAIPCPHVAKCTLSAACAGEVLRSYAELYGMEEFQPVSLRDLVTST